jgi:hypothetical protein
MNPPDSVDRWWPVDPASGAQLPAQPGATGPADCYLGDGPLEAVAVIAAAIDAGFNPRRHFSHEEVRALLSERRVPASVEPHDDAAEELLDFVESMWLDVDACYQRAWGRDANPDERRLIVDYGTSLLRP